LICSYYNQWLHGKSLPPLFNPMPGNQNQKQLHRIILHELIFSWHVIAMKSDCFIILFEPAVTSESNYFGNGCRLLGRKPLWIFYTLSTSLTTFSVWLFLGHFARLKTNFPWYFVYSKLRHFNFFQNSEQ